MRRLLTVLVPLLALVATACGGDDPGNAEPGTVAVEGVDYAYVGVPSAPVPVGTELGFSNRSADEVHELILVRLPAGDDRSLDDLLRLPESEQAALFGGLVGVSVAFPGEDGALVEGSLTVQQPGRYGLFCFVQEGTDPDAFREALDGGSGAPEITGTGLPHALLGMTGTFVVE